MFATPSSIRLPATDDLIGLTEDLPNQQLHAGDTGVVCSIWFMPDPTYEVEFHGVDPIDSIRVLLASTQFQLIEGSVLHGKN